MARNQHWAKQITHIAEYSLGDGEYTTVLLTLRGGTWAWENGQGGVISDTYKRQTEALDWVQNPTRYSSNYFRNVRRCSA